MFSPRAQKVTAARKEVERASKALEEAKRVYGIAWDQHSPVIQELSEKIKASEATAEDAKRLAKEAEKTGDLKTAQHFRAQRDLLTIQNRVDVGQLADLRKQLETARAPLIRAVLEQTRTQQNLDQLVGEPKVPM